MILTPKNISKNLKLRIWYFFGTPYNILRGKKLKIVRVTARSIWAEMLHKNYFQVYYYLCCNFFIGLKVLPRATLNIVINQSISHCSEVAHVTVRLINQISMARYNHSNTFSSSKRFPLVVSLFISLSLSLLDLHERIIDTGLSQCRRDKEKEPRKNNGITL